MIHDFCESSWDKPTGSRCSTMKLHIHLYASLASHLPEKSDRNSCFLEVADGMTIRQLLEQLGIPENAPKILFRNGVHAELDEIMKDGDRVAVFPPIAGG